MSQEYTAAETSSSDGSASTGLDVGRRLEPVEAFLSWQARRAAGALRAAPRMYGRLDLSAQVSFWVILFIGAAALLAPYITPHDPSAQLAITESVELKLASPSTDHPMGTDLFGRDVYTRLVYGARVSLVVGLGAVGFSLAIGVVAGGVAGYKGGWVDEVIMRAMDIVISFPTLVLAIALVGAVGASLENIIFVVGFVYSPQFARVTRGQVLSVKEEEFVEAADNTGISHMRILFRHVLPNSLAPVFVQATFLIAGAILAESSLSYLGLGVQPPTPTWGVMISNGQGYVEEAWWWSAFPGLAIMITVLALNLLGDGLRDEFDPRSQTEGGPNQ